MYGYFRAFFTGVVRRKEPSPKTVTAPASATVQYRER